MSTIPSYRPRWRGDATYFQALDCHFDAIAARYNLDDRWLAMDDQAQLDLLFGVGERRTLVTLPPKGISTCPLCPANANCELSRDDAVLIARLTEKLYGRIRAVSRVRIARRMHLSYARLDPLLVAALDHDLIRRKDEGYLAVKGRFSRPRYIRLHHEVFPEKASKR